MIPPGYTESPGMCCLCEHSDYSCAHSFKLVCIKYDCIVSDTGVCTDYEREK